MRLNDVRLRGCGFTLFPAAEAHAVSKELMHTVLTLINKKTLCIDSNGICTPNASQIEEENPEMPTQFSTEDFSAEDLSNLIQSGILTEELALTPLALQILEEAAQKQKELDEQGFHFCPCHMM